MHSQRSDSTADCGEAQDPREHCPSAHLFLPARAAECRCSSRTRRTRPVRYRPGFHLSCVSRPSSTMHLLVSRVTLPPLPRGTQQAAVDKARSRARSVGEESKHPSPWGSGGGSWPCLSRWLVPGTGLTRLGARGHNLVLHGALEFSTTE